MSPFLELISQWKPLSPLCIWVHIIENQTKFYRREELSKMVANVNFHDINKKEQILSFLDTKIKDLSKDPEKRWITSWNHYLTRIKLFFRWLYNKDKETDKDYWEIPDFLRIKNKKTKRISPYVESEIWDKDVFKK